ncbi:MAG: PAS domain-containing protein, partial [Desulfobulbaceae bacterium]
MKHQFPLTLETVSFINALPHGIALLDGSGSVMALNSALEVITGRKTEAIAGIPLNLVLRTSLPRHDDILRSPGAGNPVTLETDIINADRKKIPVRLTVSPIAGVAREKCLLCCMEDISAIRKLDRER